MSRTHRQAIPSAGLAPNPSATTGPWSSTSRPCILFTVARHAVLTFRAPMHLPTTSAGARPSDTRPTHTRRTIRAIRREQEPAHPFHLVRIPRTNTEGTRTVDPRSSSRQALPRGDFTLSHPPPPDQRTGVFCSRCNAWLSGVDFLNSCVPLRFSPRTSAG